ncbi:DUF1738 domain-containing protein [Cardiobacterium sp. AH-315-I02]|nr:DUF1738 domain-containing protein [Cardiobacterium sp. AH-315-I02]
MKQNKKDNQVNWADLLKEAVNKKGILSQAYSAFHDYSLGNQMLAFMQCLERDIEVSPINTYNGWKGLNRQVKKGAKAISLCMPVTRKYKGEDKKTGEEKEQTYQSFIFKNNWFLLSDTEGDEVPPLKLPEFDVKQALKNLDITEITFEYPNGNVQGFAAGRDIAVSPIAALPHKTRFHEIAHVVLGHTVEFKKVDSEKTKKDIKEVEAESVAYILCSVLGLEGIEYSRGYIQHWLKGQPIPEKSARKIFATTDKILKAGIV